KFRRREMNHHGPPIIGCSAPAEKLRGEVEQIACTDLTVMIRGEKGTGKDVVAREIHRRSNRASGPFVRVNCASVPDELAESELFGCEKGAFSGDESRTGRIEQTNCGRVFHNRDGKHNSKTQRR